MTPSGPDAREALTIDGGMIADVDPDAFGVRAFKGIPYAAPPIGDLRWREPQPVAPWRGVRKADRWGPRAMQSNRLGDIDPLNPRMSEDCLYLNVWTPAGSARERLPALFWIHGGSNNVGAASLPEYDGANLARKGVVVVSINYRLDVFGFLAHPDLTVESATASSGNYGLLDQIAALRWVRDNIAAFGGDPRRVTVFGESAGAFDISLLMVSPLTKGLFIGAIGQSGGALTPIPDFGPKPLAIGEQVGSAFARALGASSLAELRARPAAQVLEAAIKSPIVYGFGVVDGYVAPDHPAAIFAHGGQHDVPLLVGRNSDEGTLFAARIPQPPTDASSTAALIRARFGERAPAALELYPAGATPQQAMASWAALVGDQIIVYGAWAWAERAAATGRAPTYRYCFTWRPPGAPELSVCPLAAPGVYHSAELYYVFDNLHVRDWPWRDEDRRLADAMSSYWINFAATGDPNGAGLPGWAPYRPGGGGAVMQLGAPISAGGEDRRARYEFLERFYRETVQR